MVGPHIIPIITADVSRYIDKYGHISRDGCHVAWRTLAGAPAGAVLRLNVGTLSYASGELVHNLIDAGVLNASTIEVSGSDSKGVTELVRALEDSRHASAA